jgi:hypothetical protein
MVIRENKVARGVTDDTGICDMEEDMTVDIREVDT